MAFKSEIHVAELVSIRTGHAEGDIYYILDNGMLDDLPCKPGTFVKWHNGAWQIQPDEHYALASGVNGDITKAIDNVLDDGSASETVVVAVPSSQSNNYTVGNYYEVQGKVAKLRAKTEGDDVTHLTFDTTSGVLEAINSNSGKIAVFKVTYPMGQTVYPDPDEILAAIDAGKFVVIDQPNIALPGNHTEWLLEYSSRGAQDTIKFINGSNTLIAARDNTAEEPLWQWETGYTVGIVNFGDKTEADLVEGVLTILGGDSLTKLTLTTAQTLTVKANSDVPNFALEIDNTGNSNDVTVTVVDSLGTALKASAAGGDTVGAGKYVQLTCVGSCWTLAEFTVPTP